ncbi:MAG: DUF6599 family protein [Bryobacteraceae bacterium]
MLFAAAGAAQAPECGLAPGWKQQGEGRTYTAENLFEYMDGNAEGYILYRVVKMDGVNCESPAGTLVFDVFEMADPEWAYGVYTANRDPRVATEKIGVAGQVVPRQTIFVKDKYFVQISSDRDQPELLRQFALAFAQRIPGRNDPPGALAWFPAERLRAESIRMVPESVLGLRALRRGYVAQYDYGKAFVVREDTPEAAAAVMAKLRARIGGSRAARIADEGFEANDKYLGRLCVFRKGRYIGGFTGLEAGADIVALAAALADRIR